MGQLDRLREARLAAQNAALERWIKRADERAENKRDIAAGGIGAADSPQRNARFKMRQATLAHAIELRSAGLLPFTIERKMGPSLDYVPYAPSEGARRAGRPVARVVILGGPGTQPEGIATSFLVSPRLLMTNHHVFPTRSDAVGMGANFSFEKTERGTSSGVTFEIDPDAFYLSDERLDVALVAVKPLNTEGRQLGEFGWIALIEATPKILIGQPINIIQHPDGGPKQYAVTQNKLVDILDEGFLHYETDTLEGSSGSPAYSQSWELVALHHASIPEMRNGRVVATDGGVWESGMPDDKVHWIANEGARVSAIVRYLSSLKMSDTAEQVLLTQLLATTSDPVDDLIKSEKQQPWPSPLPGLPDGNPCAGGLMAHNRFSFSGPVQFHVYAPGAQAAPLPERSAVAIKSDAELISATEAVIRFDRNYDNREGYNPRFLDPDAAELEVPTPDVGHNRHNEILTDRQGKPLVLKYHHFELVMNERRRLQMWSAVNVDYDPVRKSKGDRKSFGTDKWIPDPRIPERAQIFDSEFYKPAGNIDRGHIVRREDNAWGDTDSEIEYANSDTFHWTNCTPQHEAFNQSAPGRNDATYRGMKGLWGDFENFIQTSLKDDDTRACILAGPVLDKRDPSADLGAGEIQYPLNFWKVVAVAPRDEDGKRALRVYGFLLSQADVVDRFGIEVFRPGRFKRYQVSLKRITALTGVTFADHLHKADTMEGSAKRVDIVDGSEIRGLPPAEDQLKTHESKSAEVEAKESGRQWPRPEDGGGPGRGRKKSGTA